MTQTTTKPLTKSDKKPPSQVRLRGKYSSNPKKISELMKVAQEERRIKVGELTLNRVPTNAIA